MLNSNFTLGRGGYRRRVIIREGIYETALQPQVGDDIDQCPRYKQHGGESVETCASIHEIHFGAGSGRPVNVLICCTSSTRRYGLMATCTGALRASAGGLQGFISKNKGDAHHRSPPRDTRSSAPRAHFPSRRRRGTSARSHPPLRGAAARARPRAPSSAASRCP